VAEDSVRSERARRVAVLKTRFRSASGRPAPTTSGGVGHAQIKPVVLGRIEWIVKVNDRPSGRRPGRPSLPTEFRKSLEIFQATLHTREFTRGVIFGDLQRIVEDRTAHATGGCAVLSSIGTSP